MSEFPFSMYLQSSSMFILLHLILGFACVLNLVVVLFLWWIFLSDQCFLFFVCVFALILFEWMAVSLPLTCHKHNTMKSGKNGLMTHHVTAISKTTTNCIERMVCILALIGCWPCPKNRCKTAKIYEAKKLSSSSLHVAGPALTSDGRLSSWRLHLFKWRSSWTTRYS